MEKIPVNPVQSLNASSDMHKKARYRQVDIFKREYSLFFYARNLLL